MVMVLSGCGGTAPDAAKTGSLDKSVSDQEQAARRPPLLEALDPAGLGIDFHHDADFSDEYAIYEPLGSGVGVIDLDNDGWLDLFFPQYGPVGTPTTLYRNVSQNGTLAFSKMDLGKNGAQSVKESLDGQRRLVFVAVADADNDGREDILTGGRNSLQLWLNRGQGVFVHSDWLQAPAEESFFSGASWFDANADGWLDVWVTNYVDSSRHVECLLVNGAPGYCAPSAYPDRADRFFFNVHGEGMRPADSPLIAPRAGLGVVAADFDNNGWPDVYVANDQQNNQLFFNDEGQVQADQAMRRGAAFDFMGQVEASMGVAVGDVDDNGFVDLYVTHYQAETNTLYLNQDGHFADKTAQKGLVTAVRPFTGFGTAFLDLDGDNRLDVVVVNGSVVTTEKGYGQHSNGRLHAEPVQVWFQREGTFVYQGDLVEQLPRRVGRGLAPVDLDNDGDKDVVISNNNQPPTILRNNSNPSRWLGLDVRCHGRPALGAAVILRTNQGGRIYRHVHTDGSYASSQDPRLLFADLDPKDTLEIRWPQGQEIALKVNSLALNRYHRIDCPETASRLVEDAGESV